eukprot:11265538-Alexandrium_andersonii.AAC.1
MASSERRVVTSLGALPSALSAALSASWWTIIELRMSAICALASRSLGETSGWAGGGERDARSAAAAPGLTLPREGERAA